jgi:hypothetical protein
VQFLGWAQLTLTENPGATSNYGISKSSAHRILREDLKLHAYKIAIEPKLTEEHKNKRKNLLIGSVITFEKRTQCISYFQMKKCLISMVHIIPKINVFGLLVEMRQMREVV